MNSETKDQAPKESARLLLKRLQQQFEVLRLAKPLAIGIDGEILAALPEIDRKLLRTALRMHTGATRYLKATERGAQRFNLAGEAVGEISTEHRERAAAVLKERFERREEEEKARREAEAQAKRAEKLDQLAARFSGPGNKR